MKKLLVIDSSFSYEAIQQRGLQSSVTCRDLNGYFFHVWSVHPFATLVTSDSWCSRFGLPVYYKINSSHTFIEGKIGHFKFLKSLSTLNFIISQIKLFFILYKLIKIEKINIIRASSPLYVGLFSWALSRLAGIPFVVRVGGNHDKIYTDTKKMQEYRLFRLRFIEKRVERFIFKRADLIAGANQDNLNFALSNYAPLNKTTIFRYGNLINEKHFIDPKLRRISISVNEPFLKQKFILYVGRLEPVKRPHDVITLLSNLSKSYFEINAVLVGEGQLIESLKNYAKSNGVESKVYFMGNKDQNWLSGILPLCSAFISPHTGRALTEAALAGAPVVAYDVDWQSEIIIHEETGELVPFGDTQKLTESTIKILLNKDYSNKIGTNLRELTLEMMDPISLNAHEKNQYEILLKNCNYSK
jgi:glycosyltransferase involved in cell wall biosynthesis